MDEDRAPDQACPLCDKEVAGRSALIGHLEFGHDLDDGHAWLAEHERPTRSGRSWSAGVGAIIAGVVTTVAMAAGGIAVYQAFAVGADRPVAAEAPTTTSPSVASPTTVVVPDTVSPDTVSPDTVSPDTVSPDTVPPTTTTTVADASGFRAPFLRDAHTTGCAADRGQALHEVAFTLSGGLDITLDGSFYPGDSSDGPRTLTIAIPSGDERYVDEITVHDLAGGEHSVTILPPVRLAGC